MIAIYKRLEANNALFGLLCVVIATLGLSFKAILIKLVYATDPRVDAVTILTLRFLFSIPFFVILLYFSSHAGQSKSVNSRDIAIMAALGAIGFYVPAILDFTALAYISAGLERLILFLYPTFVVAITLLVRPKEITINKILALFISYAGIVVVFAGQATQLHDKTIMGALMVFAAAIVFAVYTVMSAKQILRHGSVRFTGYAMIAATLISLIHAFSVHAAGMLTQSAKVYELIFLMAVFSTVLPLLLMAEGVKRIGASSTSIISTSGPPVTLALAFFLLGESISLLQVIGGMLVIAGVFFVSRPKTAKM